MYKINLIIIQMGVRIHPETENYIYLSLNGDAGSINIFTLPLAYIVCLKNANLENGVNMCSDIVKTLMYSKKVQSYRECIQFI